MREAHLHWLHGPLAEAFLALTRSGPAPMAVGRRPAEAALSLARRKSCHLADQVSGETERSETEYE